MLRITFKLFKLKTFTPLQKVFFFTNKPFLKKSLLISILGLAYLFNFQERTIFLIENEKKNEILFKISFEDFISIKDKLEILEKQLQQIKECEDMVFVCGLRESGKTQVIKTLTNYEYNFEYSELNLFESYHDKKKRNYIEISIDLRNNEYNELLEYFFMSKLLKKSRKSMVVFVVKEKYLNNSQLHENLKEALQKMQIFLINVDETLIADRKFIFVVNESGVNSKSEENMKKVLKIVNDDCNLARKQFLNRKNLCEKIKNSKFISLRQLNQNWWSKMISKRINKESILNYFSLQLLKELEVTKGFENKIVVENENCYKLKELRSLTENYLKSEIKNIQLNMIKHILSLDNEKFDLIYPDIKIYEINDKNPSQKIKISSRYVDAIWRIFLSVVLDKILTERSVSESIEDTIKHSIQKKYKNKEKEASFFKNFKSFNDRGKITKYLEFLKDNNINENLGDIGRLDDLFHYAFDIFNNLEVLVGKSILPLGFKSNDLVYLLNHEIFLTMEEEIKKRELTGNKSKTSLRKILMNIKYEFFNFIHRIELSD